MKITRYILTTLLVASMLMIVVGNVSASTQIPTSTDQARATSSTQHLVVIKNFLHNHGVDVAQSSDEARAAKNQTASYKFGSSEPVCKVTPESTDQARQC